MEWFVNVSVIVQLPSYCFSFVQQLHGWRLNLRLLIKEEDHVNYRIVNLNFEVIVYKLILFVIKVRGSYKNKYSDWFSQICMMKNLEKKKCEKIVETIHYHIYAQ